MKSQPNKKRANPIPTEKRGLSVQNVWPSLTGIRGLAALWVLLLHAYLMAGKAGDMPAPIEWLMAMGGTGVDVFFTLSAFLLAMPFAEAARRKEAFPNLFSYARKRFFRIIPAYYFQIIFVLVLALLGVGAGMPWSAPTPGGVFAHSVLWINAWPLVPAYVPTWWTLPVEFGFYMLLPWLAIFLTDRRWYWLLLGIALSLLYRHVLMQSGLTRAEEVYWVDHLPGRLFQFLIGMLAAFFFVRFRFHDRLPKERPRNLMVFFSTIVLLSLPSLGWLQGSDAYHGAPTTQPVLAYWHLYASVCIAIMLLAIASGKNLLDSILQSSVLQWLGRISYGVYLWHYPVMVIVRENMGGIDAARSQFIAFFVVSFVVSITLAFLSWHWLEAPILRRAGSSSGL